MVTRMRDVANRLNLNAGSSLYRQGESIMTRSKTEFVPVKSGRLKNSGRVDLPFKLPDGWQVDMVYGGPDAPYAATVHETPGRVHPNGQWKYLEQPMREASGYLLPTIAVEMTVGV